MNKKTLIAGLIVLMIGVALVLFGEQLIASNINAYPHGIPINSRASYYFALASTITGGIVVFSGIILLIYAFVLPDPPVHWKNNL